ncbi:hypothetical protein SAMN03080602_03745 [Arenibacter troitsensis]|uniref:Uncharacterized protein n=1 Tax=Arenibacter troitsensis TaxID=188872 RepID=A0A1X7L4P2_9FLAO|nr:hypothetical protein SAMN03080602_03745 [Arenibacter troitsensis]
MLCIGITRQNIFDIVLCSVYKLNNYILFTYSVRSALRMFAREAVLINRYYYAFRYLFSCCYMGEILVQCAISARMMAMAY